MEIVFFTLALIDLAGFWAVLKANEWIDSEEWIDGEEWIEGKEQIEGEEWPVAIETSQCIRSTERMSEGP